MTLKAKTATPDARLRKMKANVSNLNGVKNLNAVVPEEIYEAFKIACIKNKTTMTDVFISMMISYVKKAT